MQQSTVTQHNKREKTVKIYTYGTTREVTENLQSFDAMALEFEWSKVNTIPDARRVQDDVRNRRALVQDFIDHASAVFDSLNKDIANAKAALRSMDRQDLECSLVNASGTDRLVIRTIKSKDGGLTAGRALFAAMKAKCRLPFSQLAKLAGEEFSDDETDEEVDEEVDE